MNLFKSYSNKVGKKHHRPDLKSSMVLTADRISASGGGGCAHTSAITSVQRSSQAESTSLLSETLVYQPPTAVTPCPVFTSPFVGPSSLTRSIPRPETAASESLLVVHAKATPSSEKEKDSKMEAAASYMYGPKVDDGYQSEKKPSSSISDMQPPRTNRAQALRHERNASRINEEKLMREQMMKQRIMRAQSDTTGISSDLSDDEEGGEGGEPLHARVIPKSLYHKPKITVRDTVSSKFRYLFNRKPAGVNVYFKQADEKDTRKKPPFILGSKQHCF